MKYGFRNASITPRVIVGIYLTLQKLLDLSDRRVRRQLGFTLNDLMQEDWRAIQSSGEESWTQAIGRGSQRAGLEGIIAPSARDPKRRNVIIFPDNLLPDSGIELMGRGELPRHPPSAL